jgi:hypothetical protein
MRKETISKKNIYEKCLEGIEKYNPSSLTELLKQLEPFFSRQTFYNKIKTDSKEYSDIVEKLEHKKTVFANTLKDKFYEMNNFKSLELLFKLYCTKEDREALAQKFDVNTNQNISFEDDIKRKEQNLKNLSTEERKILLELIKKLNSDG